MPRIHRGLVAGATAAVLALTACGTSRDEDPTDDDQPQAFYETGIHESPDAGDPVSGGTLTFADYSETRSLDPTKVISSGFAGGNVMVALYDQLIRWNEAEETYEPQLAESLDSNDDFTEWTITLREDITFSNGTPLDADAVLGSFDYYFANGGSDAAVIGPVWGGATKVDDRTIVITLTDSWASFPFALGKGLGFIIAPEAIANGPDAFEPIGAGAFTFDSYRPAEELVLNANPEYWDGAPHLESLRFVWLGADETKFESLETGAVHGGQALDVASIKQARENDQPGWVEMQNNVAMIAPNQADGRPGQSPEVRRAMALAIDADAVSERIFDGDTIPTKHLFAPTSPWYAEDVDELAYDPEAAAQLLEEAKADGFAGNVVLHSMGSPAYRELALSIGSYLEAAGFTVEYDFARSVADSINKVFVDRDFDFARTSFTIGDRVPYWNLYRNLYSSAPTNAAGINDPELDALIDELRGADEDEMPDVTHRLEERFQEYVHFINLDGSPMMVFWDESAHGISPTNDTMVAFDKAWLSE